MYFCIIQVIKDSIFSIRLAKSVIEPNHKFTSTFCCNQTLPIVTATLPRLEKNLNDLFSTNIARKFSEPHTISNHSVNLELITTLSVNPEGLETSISSLPSSPSLIEVLVIRKHLLIFSIVSSLRTQTLRLSWRKLQCLIPHFSSFRKASMSWHQFTSPLV